jgi:hypothetical protein
MEKNTSHGADQATAIAVFDMACRLKAAGVNRDGQTVDITVQNDESPGIDVGTNAFRIFCNDSPRVACTNISFFADTYDYFLKVGAGGTAAPVLNLKYPPRFRYEKILPEATPHVRVRPVSQASRDAHVLP